MQIKDIMDLNVTIVREDTTLRETLLLMDKNDGHLFPVVNKNTTLVGVVSVQDLLRSLYPDYSEFGNDFPSIEHLEERVNEVWQIPIKDIMHTVYMTTTPYAPVLKVGSEMIIRKVTHVPVIDSANRVVGMVSQRMLFESLMNKSILGQSMPTNNGHYVEEPPKFAPEPEKLFPKSELLKKFPEKRLFERIESRMDAYFEIADSDEIPPLLDPRQNASVTNLSAGGAMMEVGERLTPGTLLYVGIYLKKNEIPIECLSRVIRREKNFKKDQYEVSVMFLALTAVERQKIEKHIRKTRIDQLWGSSHPGNLARSKSWLLFN